MPSLMTIFNTCLYSSSDRHANAYFMCPLIYGIADDAVNSSDCQNERRDRKG